MKYLDLTHTFRNDMHVYPGDTKPEIRQTTFFDKQGFNCFKISTGMHVGTHMDAPLHMLQNGKKLTDYPPERFFGKGHLIDARNKPITGELLYEKNIVKGDIILIFTGFDKNFGQDSYYMSFPQMSEEFAQKISDLEISIVGMDTPSPDGYPFPIHKILMGNDILIIENLTGLEALLVYKEFDVIALPAKYDCEAAPVRVIVKIIR
ncbi:MAG: hypothetical protein A2X47_02240 [Lentisphaerae bacterium GWF2_38_69]|nr:MAG: hypothetical protein A2X47_02240 [Lentisphaerae bacterium GWF2_38_69]